MKTIPKEAEAAAEQIAKGWLSKECTEPGRRLFKQGARMGYEKGVEAEKEKTAQGESCRATPSEGV